MIIRNIYAQSKDLGSIGGGDGFGPWGNLDLTNIGGPARAFATIISNIIGVLTIVAGLWFIFQLITSAIGIMSASGDPKKLESSSTKIKNAVVGLVVVAAAYALISLLSRLLDFDFLNVVSLITNLGPRI